MNEEKQIKFGVIFSYINIAVRIVVSLLYTPILIRTLGQNEYGLFSIAFSAIGLFSILDLGLGNANIRYTAKYRAEGDVRKEHQLHGMFFLMYSAIGIIGLIAGMFFVQNVNIIYGKAMSLSELYKLKYMFMIVVLSLSVSFPLSVFGFIIRGYERFVFAQISELVRSILMPVLSIVVMLAGYRSVGVIAIISILNLVVLLANAMFCFKALRVKLAFKSFDYSLLKEILGYSFFVFLGIIALRVDNSSNQMILGAISGSKASSIYSLAFNLVINFMTLSTAISSVFLPRITKVPSDENQISVFNGYFIALGRLQFFALALVYSGFLFFGKQFIALWAGPGFENSYTIALILMAPLGVYLIQTTGLSILQAINKHRFSSLVFFTGSVLNIVFSIFLSKVYDELGATISLALIWFIAYGFTMNVYYRKKVGLDIASFWAQIIRILPAILPAILCAVVFLYFNEANTWLGLMTGVIIYTTIYVISLIYLSFNQFEKDLLLKPAHLAVNKIFRGSET